MVSAVSFARFCIWSSMSISRVECFTKKSPSRARSGMYRRRNSLTIHRGPLFTPLKCMCFMTGAGASGACSGKSSWREAKIFAISAGLRVELYGTFAIGAFIAIVLGLDSVVLLRAGTRFLSFSKGKNSYIVGNMGL